MSEKNMTTHERRAEHVRAFEQVIEMYKDINATGGGSTLPRGVSKDSKVVMPSTCDFLCDVSLTVNRALPTANYRAIFHLLYTEQSREESVVVPEVLAYIKDRVGQLLISRKVYPTQQYFKGKAIINGRDHI